MAAKHKISRFVKLCMLLYADKWCMPFPMTLLNYVKIHALPPNMARRVIEIRLMTMRVQDVYTDNT